MEKGLSKPQDQVQAIYLAQANIFSYEARKSAKSWVPLCDSTVPISILYDNTRSIYRIISVDADIKEVVVNTTVVPELEFVKTTQKFGYWKDLASGRVFGIGFASEYEAEAFDECLRKIKQNLGPPSVNSSVNLNQTDSLRNEDNSAYQPPRIPLNHEPTILQGQGDGPVNAQEQMQKKMTWEDYEQVSPSVLNFLRNNRQTTIPPMPVASDDRPRTYKVDLPIIPSPSQTQAASSTQSQLTSSYHQQTLPFPYFPGNVPIEVIPMPFPMSQVPISGYNYQGPPSFRRLPTGSQAPPDEKSNSNPSGADLHSGERRELIDEINRLRNENVKLSQSLIESSCSAKKWEVQVNSLRDDNIQLVKSVADGNGRLEGLMREVRDNKEQANRWKEHYNQAISSAKEKGQQLRDAEDKLRHISTDKARVESVLKDLEDELKRQQQISKEQQSQTSHVAAGQYTNKYFKELEEHYRKLLSDSQKRIEEILRKDSDRKNVLRGVDTLFTGAIQGLINIHGQIRQAYEQ